MTGEVHGIAARRAKRQMITVAGGPDLSIKTLGPARIGSPLAALLDTRQTTEHYVDEGDRVLLDDTLSMVRARGGSVGELPSFEPAGPRRKIFFDPSKTRAGIVTCGGLCPGLNDVIRGLVRNLTNHYGVRRVVGFRNGYQGVLRAARAGRDARRDVRSHRDGRRPVATAIRAHPDGGGRQQAQPGGPAR